LLRGRKPAVVEFVEFEGGGQIPFDVGCGRGDLGLLGTVDIPGYDQPGQHANDGNDEQKFNERETGSATSHIAAILGLTMVVDSATI
jgi:hypothetical protein